jgi:hypothetical protein
MRAMPGTPRLLEAKPTEGYAAHVRFEDGTEADIDLSYLLDYGGVFEPLRDAEFFRTLRIYTQGQTIYWPRDPAMPEGEEYEDIASVQADIAPETLYAHARRRVTAVT